MTPLPIAGRKPASRGRSREPGSRFCLGATCFGSPPVVVGTSGCQRHRHYHDSLLDPGALLDPGCTFRSRTDRGLHAGLSLGIDADHVRRLRHCPSQ